MRRPRRPRDLRPVLRDLEPLAREIAQQHRRGRWSEDPTQYHSWGVGSADPLRLRAPELLDPALGSAGPVTDVYALGLLLMERVAGRPVFGDGPPGDPRLSVRILERAEPVTLDRLGVRIGARVARVLARAVDHSPSRRPPHVPAFWADLTAAAAATPWYVREDDPDDPPIAALEQPTSASEPQPSASSTSAESEKVGWDATFVRWVVGTAGAMVFSAFVLEPVVRSILWPRGQVLEQLAERVGADRAKSFEESDHWWDTQQQAVRRTTEFDAHRAEEAFKALLPPEMLTVTADGRPPFRIDRTEVTVEAYRACIAAGACTPTAQHGGGFDPDDPGREAYLCNLHAPDRDEHPINCVSFRQADAYCHFRGKRLPTGAEWELAAGGAHPHRYPWGDPMPPCTGVVFARYGAEAWGCRLQPRGTAPVGARANFASPFGVLDMSGNVWEWTTDRSPVGGVLRGGGWDSSEAAITVRTHFEAARDFAEVSIGFRCVQ